MFRMRLVLAQALAEYAGMQLRETVGRVRSSVGMLDRTEQAVALAAVVVLAFLLLRRGTPLR